MNRYKNLSDLNEQDRLLVSRVEDAFSDVQLHYTPRFIGFLDGHQRNLAKQVADRYSGECESLFWGGYDVAERVLLGIFPPYQPAELSAFPMTFLELKWKFTSLTHRDFLGALMGLGIKREKIGDISVGEGRCMVAVDSSIERFITANLDKVGSGGVEITVKDSMEDAGSRGFKEITGTVASSRLDCVVAELLNASRSQVEKLIAGGCVSVDFETAYDHSDKVSDGSTVSIRGHGRFVIDRVGPQTRKGRYGFGARKYL